EVTKDYTVIEQAGHKAEIDAMFDALNKNKILQFVRSGRVAITRSTVERLSNFLEEMEARRKEVFNGNN
ncbi:MAG TPA: acetolactate synthase small subunit, partial [Bacteroidales bacterium]|nr:acetolactate synthase small subunit [Bacteroidales bacterium]